MIPLAADTPVYRGTAVVFHSPFSLAELFEKAMERERERREREREKERESNILIAFRLSCLS